MEEIEVKFLNIDPEAIQKKFADIGAKKSGEYFYRRRVFDYPDWRLDKQGAWLRLRDEGDRITLSFKQRLGIKSHDGSESDDGMEEVEIIVDDFDKTALLLVRIGFVEKHYAENKRIRWVKDEVEFDIDTFPELEPYLEIEARSWEKIDLSTIAFGQGISTTPIQLVTAMSAIANGGRVVRPQVVDKLLGESWEEKIKPEIGERVISEETAKEITAMMVLAAKEGEAKWTHLKGFSVAGKTGTAQIPISGHYDDEKTIASFIGFAPSDKPKFIMLVTLREPQTSPWASETAAPLWYSIAKELFPYFSIQPES